MSLYNDIVKDALGTLPKQTQKKLNDYTNRVLKTFAVACFVYAAVVSAGLAFLLWLGST